MIVVGYDLQLEETVLDFHPGKYQLVTVKEKLFERTVDFRALLLWIFLW